MLSSENHFTLSNKYLQNDKFNITINIGSIKNQIIFKNNVIHNQAGCLLYIKNNTDSKNKCIKKNENILIGVNVIFLLQLKYNIVLYNQYVKINGTK